MANLRILLALSGTFASLPESAALILSVLYIAACAASWELERRDVRLAGTPVQFRGPGFAALFGSLSMVAVIVVSPRDQILGMLAFTALGAVLYLVKVGLVRRRSVATLS